MRCRRSACATSRCLRPRVVSGKRFGRRAGKPAPTDTEPNMYAFQFERATDAKAAVDKMKADGDARFLGGGQSLLAAMKLRLAAPSALIDVTRIPGLADIRVEGDALVIGAAARHADVAAHADVKRLIPALASLANGIGDRQVRAMGTLGGSLANDDPAACYPAAVL